MTEEWFHRAFQPEPLGRVFEDPENPYVLTVGGGSAEAPLVGGCLTLLGVEHRDARSSSRPTAASSWSRT